MSKIATSFFIVLILYNLSFAQWIQTSGPSGGTVTQFAVNQSNGYVFALAGGNIYRSTDNGATWTPKSNELQANIGATVIAVSGANVYIGLTSGNTSNIIFRSTDNGDSWTAATATGIPAFYIPNAMIVAGSKLLMYSTYLLGGGKMFASTDGGETFSESTTGLPANFSVAYLTMKGTDIY
ncbi:MAG: exo-alpha-sialidase, partial [Ignavibacteriae bacterium]|nr:exo-alpha-sialidase [Ignavibacteriota bacterium]